MCTILYFVYKSDHNLSGKELHRILNSFYSQFWRETVQQGSEKEIIMKTPVVQPGTVKIHSVERWCEDMKVSHVRYLTATGGTKKINKF